MAGKGCHTFSRFLSRKAPGFNWLKYPGLGSRSDFWEHVLVHWQIESVFDATLVACAHAALLAAARSLLAPRMPLPANWANSANWATHGTTHALPAPHTRAPRMPLPVNWVNWANSARPHPLQVPPWGGAGAVAPPWNARLLAPHDQKNTNTGRLGVHRRCMESGVGAPTSTACHTLSYCELPMAALVVDSHLTRSPHVVGVMMQN